MRNRKSVLKTLSVSYDCSNGAVTGIAGNGSGIAEGGKEEISDSAVCVLPLLAIPC